MNCPYAVNKMTYLQNPKERQPTEVWKLKRGHITTYGKQGDQEDPNQQDALLMKGQAGFGEQEELWTRHLS